MLEIETKKITETVIVEKEILVINGIEINDAFFNKYKIDKISKYHSFNDSFPIRWEIELMEDHCEAISIPANFIHVAVSDACVNEAMMHQTKSLFGVQFHPEVSGNHGRVIIENFVHICQQQARLIHE